VAADLEVTGAPKNWTTTVAAGTDHVMLFYTCPRCRRHHQINVQTPTAKEPTETELWCHPCQHGTTVTIQVSSQPDAG
jgi:transcription elongation factor Elf1